MEFRIKNFNFDKFWQDFASEARGRWDVIMPIIVPDWPSNPYKAFDCPNAAAHPNSNGVRKSRVLRDFAQTGNIMCSCYDNSCISGLGFAKNVTGRNSFRLAIEAIQKLNLSVMCPEGLAVERIKNQPAPPRKKQREFNSEKFLGWLASQWDSLSHDQIVPTQAYCMKRQMDHSVKYPDIRYGFLSSKGVNEDKPAPVFASLIRCAKTLYPVGMQRCFLTNTGDKLVINQPNGVELVGKKTTQFVPEKEDEKGYGRITILRMPDSSGIINVVEGAETGISTENISYSGAVLSAFNNHSMEKILAPDVWMNMGYVREMVYWVDHDPKSNASIISAIKSCIAHEAIGLKTAIMYPIPSSHNIDDTADVNAIAQSEVLMSFSKEERLPQVAHLFKKFHWISFARKHPELVRFLENYPEIIDKLKSDSSNAGFISAA